MMDDEKNQTAIKRLRWVSAIVDEVEALLRNGHEGEVMGALLDVVCALEEVIDIVRLERGTTWTAIASMYPRALAAMPMLVAFSRRPGFADPSE